MKALVCAALTVALAGATAPAAKAAATGFDGKLWILPGSVSATFPVPTATPDATFLAEGLALFSSAPGPSLPNAATVDITVGAFLRSSNPIRHLKFSGLVNPALGVPVSDTTPTVNSNAQTCGTYSTYIEFTGTLRLVHNEFFYIGVDDGVSMMIDGAIVLAQSGDGSTFYQFPGKTGKHAVDFVYSNVCGGGWLSVGPKM